MRRTVLVVAVLLLIGAAGAGGAGASYRAVTGDLVQWEWATVSRAGAYRVTDLVVRDDGWMIVATTTYGDGHLHLVPPWGGVLGEATRFGPTNLGFRQLELRRGRLYGLRQATEREEDKHATAELFELDARTGGILRPLGRWWFQDLAVDPVTDELLLQTSGGGREPYAHDLVRFDPDRNTTKVVVADTEPRSDRALEVAFSPDGQRMFTANVTDVPPTIDVRSRDGSVLHTLQSGQVDSMTMGRPGTCFDGMLLITRFDGSVLGIGTEPNAQAVPLATGGRAGVVSYAGLDRDGHIAAARYDNVTLLACPGFVPPTPPATPRPPAPPVRAAVAAPEVAAPPAPPAPPTAAATADAAAAATPPGAPAATPPPPPPAPPGAVPVAPPGAIGTAIQASGAPSAAGADAPDEEHVTSVAAAATPTMVLLLGAAVAACMTAYAVGAATPPRDIRLQTSRGNHQ